MGRQSGRAMLALCLLVSVSAEAARVEITLREREGPVVPGLATSPPAGAWSVACCPDIDCETPLASWKVELSPGERLDLGER